MVMMIMMTTVITAMIWSMGIVNRKAEGVGRFLAEVEVKVLKRHHQGRNVAGVVLLPQTKVLDHQQGGKLELAKEEGLVSHKLYSNRSIWKFCSLSVENRLHYHPLADVFELSRMLFPISYIFQFYFVNCLRMVVGRAGNSCSRAVFGPARLWHDTISMNTNMTRLLNGPET